MFGKIRQEPFFPKPLGFMSELETPQQEELGDIPIAELVADAAEQRLEEDIGRDFDEVEKRVRALVESSATAFAAKHGVAQGGLPLKQ